jgi:hypothetical protein
MAPRDFSLEMQSWGREIHVVAIAHSLRSIRVQAGTATCLGFQRSMPGFPGSIWVFHIACGSFCLMYAACLSVSLSALVCGYATWQFVCSLFMLQGGQVVVVALAWAWTMLLVLLYIVAAGWCLRVLECSVRAGWCASRASPLQRSVRVVCVCSRCVPALHVFVGWREGHAASFSMESHSVEPIVARDLVSLRAMYIASVSLQPIRASLFFFTWARPVPIHHLHRMHEFEKHLHDMCFGKLTDATCLHKSESQCSCMSLKANATWSASH